MSNNRNLGNIATAITNATSGQVLTSQGNGVATFADAAGGSSVTTVTNVSGASDSLTAISSPSVGDIVFVTSTNGLFIRKSNGWFKIADVTNLQPTNLTGVSDSDLAIDGTATTLTLAATDPEGLALTFSAAAKTGSITTFSAALTDGNTVNALNGSTVIATVAQASNVFTITPNTANNDGTVDITFSVTDGVNTALTDDGQFTLTFVTVVTDSNHTTLLVTATGTSNNSGITDSSSANSGSGHNITVNGDTFANTFSPYRSGGYSVHLDDGEEISFPDSPNYNISNGLFSIEAWVNPTSYDSPWSGVISQFSSSSRGWALAFSSTQITFLGSTNGGSSTNVNGSVTSSVPLNQWTHLLVTRDSNTIRIFKNGVLINSFTESGTFNNSTDPLRIGELNPNASENFRGHIRDARVVKGSIPTEYQTSSTTNGTTIFTAPSEPLTAVTNTVLLTCHLPYISDGSANDATPTLSGSVSTKPSSPYDYNEYDATDHGGSLYFNGTDSAVQIADNDDFDFGTGDLTIECWVYPEETSNNYPGFLGTSAGWGSVAASGFRFDNLGDSKFQMSWYGPGDPFLETQSTYKHNQWYHFVVTRTGGNSWRMFVNGILEDTGTNSTAYDISIGGYNLQVGGKTWDGGNGWFKGNVADLRLTKGSVVSEYQTTSTTVGTKIFTPRTSPISSSGSELHLKGTDASIIDKSQSVNIKLEGGVNGSTDQVRTGNWANTKTMYFDAEGDYIDLSGGFIPLRTSDFTIETWFYPTASPPNHEGIFSNGTHNSGNWVALLYNTSRKIRYDIAGSTNNTSTTQLSLNNWYHIMLCRFGGNTRLYINGVHEHSRSNSSDLSYETALIGNRIGLSGYVLSSAYLQDFRITKGLVRHVDTQNPTTSFTPPSAPLEG